jgi:hypothetical protein
VYFPIKISPFLNAALLAFTFKVLVIPVQPALSQSIDVVEDEPTAKSGSETLQCERLFKKYAVPWQQLWSKRSKELRDEHTGGLSQIADMTIKHCSEPESAKILLTTLSRLMNKHSGKIAVLLPSNSPSASRSIMRGLESALKNMSLDPKRIIITLDTQGSPGRLEQVLSDALYRHQASVLIGGFNQKEIETLVSWGSKLSVPTLILNKPALKTKSMKAVFYTHPTPRGLAEALVAANKRQRHNKISIMRPPSPQTEEIAKHYEEIARSKGLEVLHHVIYDPRRADQIESSARKLFRLEPNDRRDELTNLYKSAKEHAARNNQPFNPDMVALAPEVTQDAVLILDQFKNARHIIKILSYLGVTKLPVFGTGEFRSKGLIEPWDPFLAGAYFVDYIGPYNTLPKGIASVQGSDAIFVDASRVDDLDFALIGYKAGDIASMFISQPDMPRRKLHTLTPNAKSPDRTFSSDGVLQWPHYLFEVGSSGQSGSVSFKAKVP